MEMMRTEEQRSALWALVAGAAGIAVFYIRNSWCASSVIVSVPFEMLFIVLFYMLMPFAFSGVFVALFGYVGRLVRGGAEVSVLSVAMLVLACGVAGYAIIGLQEGTVLIISGVLFVLRLLHRFSATY